MTSTAPGCPAALASQREALGLAGGVSDLRDRGATPRVRTPFGHEATLITRYDEVRALHGDPRLSLGAVPPPAEVVAAGGVDDFERRRVGMLLMMDAPDHTRVRRLLTAAFTGRRVQELALRVHRIVDEHLDAMAAGGPLADLVEAFALPVPAMVICELLGVPFEDRAGFAARSTRMLDGATAPPERLRLAQEARSYMTGLVERTRSAPGDDLLGLLVRQHDDDASALTDAELVGVADLLLLAGHETTSNVIALGTLTLLEHPDQLARLRDEPSCVDAAVEEILRHTAVVHGGFPRIAVEDTTIGEHEVAAGELVVSSLCAANRDPLLLPDGDRFDITREPMRHLTFGHGIHHCLGAALARLELRVALPALLRRFPGLRLAEPAAAPDFVDGTLVYGLDSLPVAW